MNYIEKVDKLIGIMLEAEENHESVELILDADLAFDVAVTLQDELGKRFCEEDDFDYLLEHSDILSLAITRDKFGALYFLSEAIYEGVTLESEADTFYIHENVYSRLDTDRLLGDIIILKELDNADEDVEYTMEDELDEMFEDIVADMLNELEDVQSDDFCLHCSLKEAIQRGYIQGYKKSMEMMRNALDENLENMR